MSESNPSGCLESWNWRIVRYRQWPGLPLTDVMLELGRSLWNYRQQDKRGTLGVMENRLVACRECDCALASKGCRR